MWQNYFVYRDLRLYVMILLNGFLLVLFFFFLITFSVTAVIGEPNATVQTLLEIGNVYPEILNISIEDDAASFTLNANSTATLTCTVRIRDYNGDDDISSVVAVLFDTDNSSFGAADDNNTRYFNGSCPYNASATWGGHADDAYTGVANCTFEVQYYANAANWNCSAIVNDQLSLDVSGNDSITFDQLLALDVPSTIDYGTVNATLVSNENQTNITNAGNVPFNLSLEGYAQTEGDGYAMNCSLGAVGFIDVEYEKYRLNTSSPGDLNLSMFEANYTNLTSDSVIGNINMKHRQNDAANDAINSTYWRIYVPVGVAGNCTGNIIFGAIQANAP